MKTVRRLTVEIERRLLRIQRDGAVGVEPFSGNANMEKPKGDCPHCASPWVLLHDAGTGALNGLPVEVRTIGDIHLHRSPSGDLWMCQRSLQQFTRNSKETL